MGVVAPRKRSALGLSDTRDTILSVDLPVKHHVCNAAMERDTLTFSHRPIDKVAIKSEKLQRHCRLSNGLGICLVITITPLREATHGPTVDGQKPFRTT